MDEKTENVYGTLTICATPIGNLGDITIRALEALKSADYIAAEDTRHTLKLLNRYNIKKKLISCHEHNERARCKEIIALLKQGNSIALVSDAGMPGISDPGGLLISECIEERIRVTSCPGASAAVTALVLSGLKADRFVFEGFLPKGTKERRHALELLKTERRTIVLYEAPHRLKRTLLDVYEALGNRRIAIARELTKVYEEVLRTTMEKAVAELEYAEIKGELALVIEGAANIDASFNENTLSEESIFASLEHYVSAGFTDMEAIKKIAKDNGVPKRIVYEAVKCRT